MTTKINKIVIVGGGSAGWMTAATLISRFPNKDITLIESANIATVGVGESTIGGINDWCNLIGIKDTDFMKFTDASYKLSIRFTDFYRKDAGSFHYPFGFPNTEGNTSNKNDWYFKKFLNPDLPTSDYAECMFPAMGLVNNNKFTKNLDNRIPGFSQQSSTAYHFDATKFGLWLKDHFAKPKGAKHILADVVDIITDADGIKTLTLSTGDTVSSDLFIDCTGFKSLLLSQTMKEPFESYEDLLPNNSAWATRVEYADKEKELAPYTDCHAIGNGWVWNIPLWSRIGTGYVYSDKYISDQGALEEFKIHLQSKGRNTDTLKFKNIKMRVGLHNRLWVKNVCAIGLAAGFIEPLESNGLYTVHEFLLKLVRVLGRADYISQWDKDVFNATCKDQFRRFAEFVALHYALSHRDDTAYWRDVTSRSIADNVIQQRWWPGTPTISDSIFQRMTEYYYTNDKSGFHCIFTGMNCFPTDLHLIASHGPVDDLATFFKQSADALDRKREQWQEACKDAPKLVDYLAEMYKDTSVEVV